MEFPRPPPPFSLTIRQLEPCKGCRGETLGRFRGLVGQQEPGFGSAASSFTLAGYTLTFDGTPIAQASPHTLSPARNNAL